MTNEPHSGRAAVVKRGAEREHRDLFASKPLDIGSVKQTLRPPPLGSNAAGADESQQLGGMAARNEASVLFTVDALRAKNAASENARITTPQPQTQSSWEAPKLVDDDEGIIDLNALASVAPGQRSIAPLFSEPPPAAFASDVGPSPSSMVSMPGGFRLSKRAMAGIGAAAVALVLGCVGIAAAFKGEEPVMRSAATSMIAAPATAAAAAALAPTTAATTDPAPAAANASTTSATASNDDDSDKPKAGKKKKKYSSGAKTYASSAQSAKMSTPAPVIAKAPKVAASDKCGCHGNFDCVIRCSATGK